MRCGAPHLSPGRLRWVFYLRGLPRFFFLLATRLLLPAPRLFPAFCCLQPRFPWALAPRWAVSLPCCPPPPVFSALFCSFVFPFSAPPFGVFVWHSGRWLWRQLGWCCSWRCCLNSVLGVRSFFSILQGVHVSVSAFRRYGTGLQEYRDYTASVNKTVRGLNQCLS